MGYNKTHSQRKEADAVGALHKAARTIGGLAHVDHYPRSQDAYGQLQGAIEIAEKLHEMKQHPNYRQQAPLPGESLVQFTLRWAAHLISPPQEEQESYDLECVDIAAAIQHLAPEIEAAWAARSR